MSIFNTLKFITDHPFNRGHKLSALFGFLKWQIGTKFFKAKYIFNWVDETKFILQKSEYGMTGNLYCGFAEYEDMSFVLHCLKETDKFYDIGANVGSYTLLASGVKKCQTICFEPIPSTFDRLIDNLNLNRIEHLVDARNNGVGNEKGSLSFTNDRNTGNKVSVDHNYSNTTDVAILALDDEFNPSDITVVKVDVEGYEDFVLKGGFKFFSNPNVIALLIELNGSGKLFGIEDTEIHKTIISFGFSPITYNPFNREITQIKNFEHGGNTIYVKDFDLVQKRCLESDNFCVHTANDLNV